MSRQKVKETPKKTTKVAQKQIEFDPSKPYKWEPEDVIEFNGLEYGLLYNTLMVKKRELMGDLEVLRLLEIKLKQMVEAGIAVEAPPADPQVQ